MESAKQTLNLTKYFVSLPPSRYLIGLILLVCIIGGALLVPFSSGKWDIWSMAGGAGGMLFTVGAPAFMSALLLALLRRKAGFSRALALSLLSTIIYVAFYVAASLAGPISEWAANLVFVGFGLSLLAWFFVLRFAFGLNRSAWILAAVQLFLHSIFFLAVSGLSLESYLSDWFLKIIITSIVFLVSLGALLFIASAPMKKNLGLTSSDALSMFLSQWLYGEKDLEGAFDEIGEIVQTQVSVSAISTKNGTCFLVVPYLHFGPFGNLGGSQFSHQIASALKNRENSEVVVFHGTATHDFDPVSTSQLGVVVGACQKAIKSLSYKHATWSYSYAKSKGSLCHLLSINDCAFASFTRAPLSTEDVNFSIGWALMCRAEKKYSTCTAIDCHNSETGDVDYVETGSPIAFEMMDALEFAMGKKASKHKLYAGWATSYPSSISAIGSGGIKLVMLSSGKGKNAYAVCWAVIDGNGISPKARERLIVAFSKWAGKKKVRLNFEVFTTDTHQLNTVRGVFNPVGDSGDEDYLLLENELLELADSAHSLLSDAKFACKKEDFRVKVLGPYQSAEIVSTLNSVLSILKIAFPLILIASLAFLLWALGKF